MNLRAPTPQLRGKSEDCRGIKDHSIDKYSSFSMKENTAGVCCGFVVAHDSNKRLSWADLSLTFSSQGKKMWIPIVTSRPSPSINWVAVKELKLSYHIGETLLFTIYIPIMVT